MQKDVSMGRIIEVSPADPNLAEMLKPAIEVIHSGGVVVFPTETLYGLAADPHNPKALDRLAVLKGRPDGKPIALLASHESQLDPLIKEVPEGARRLMQEYWPGPLTLILPARDQVDPRLCSADRGVGARVTPHAVAAGLARGFGGAITATSANLTGQAAARMVWNIDPDILENADFVINAGPTPGGPPSTVLDIRSKPPRLLRPGAVILPDWVFE